jgi:hypothetical protein
MTMLSRGKVLAALAVLTILLLPPSLLAVTSPPAHAATAGTLCRHTFIPSPNVGSGDNGLDGVVTISSSDVWAVGDWQNAGAASQTLIEHWDGTSWSVVSSPSPGSNANELRSVSADAPNDVWAVGITSNTGSSLTLVEHWDSANWSVIPAVNFGSALTEFFGVTSIAPDDVWAVGDFQNTGPNQCAGYLRHLPKKGRVSSLQLPPHVNTSPVSKASSSDYVSHGCLQGSHKEGQFPLDGCLSQCKTAKRNDGMRDPR